MYIPGKGDCLKRITQCTTISIKALLSNLNF